MCVQPCGRLVLRGRPTRDPLGTVRTLSLTPRRPRGRGPRHPPGAGSAGATSHPRQRWANDRHRPPPPPPQPVTPLRDDVTSPLAPPAPPILVSGLSGGVSFSPLGWRPHPAEARHVGAWSRSLYYFPRRLPRHSPSTRAGCHSAATPAALGACPSPVGDGWVRRRRQGIKRRCGGVRGGVEGGWVERRRTKGGPLHNSSVSVTGGQARRCLPRLACDLRDTDVSSRRRQPCRRRQRRRRATPAST